MDSSIQRCSSACVLLSMVLAGCGGSGGVGRPIRVEALDCAFTLPADYVVAAGSDGTGFLSAADHATSRDVGRIDLHAVNDAVNRHDMEADLGQAERKGHLQVLEYVIRVRDQESRHARVVGLTEEMDFSGTAVELVDEMVRSCIASADPVIVKAAERRASCQMLSRARVDALFEGVGRNVVFANGQVRGWRIYDKKAVERMGLSAGDLIMQVCGTDIAEIVSVDGDICCSQTAADSVMLTVERGSGQASTVVLPLPPAG